jgi:amino acid transporter
MEAFGLSLSIVGPTVVISFITTVMEQVAGRAIPLAFVIAAVTVALIGLSFVAFGRRVAHAGSVYAYISNVFGSRCGYVAGWMLLFSYMAFTAGRLRWSAVLPRRRWRMPGSRYRIFGFL